MIDIKEKTQCCGCNACGDVCPKGAITFAADDEGFLYPQVNRDKCINCDLCRKVCPQLQAEEVKRGLKQEGPKCWAAVAKSLSVRFDSTSGGMFTTIAEFILSQGGFVGGAVWGDDFSIHQIISDRRDDLPRLRSSKYAQSDARGFYAELKRAVLTGRLVFVCGTPCQMMAVALAVGTHDNLYTADFICRGINSPLVLTKYIEKFEKEHGQKVVALKQKSKELGWRRLTTKFTFADGSIAYDPSSRSLFMRSYLEANIISRPSCYACRHKGVSRVTDLTIADCWGVVERLDPWKFDKDLGTSVVMCHSAKGTALWEKVKDAVERVPVTAAEIVKSSGTICKSLAPSKNSRTDFFATLSARGLDAACAPLFGPIAHKTFRRRLRDIAKRVKQVAGLLVAQRRHLLLFLRVNGLRRILGGGTPLLFVGNVLWQQERPSSVRVDGWFAFGTSLFRGSTLESRVYLSSESALILHGGTMSFGCNIQIYNGGTLEIGSDFYANIGATIICGGRITMGSGVTFGRNVTVRDYHGDHFLNTDGYQHTKPVTIGDHVWLCEGCTIMPGVTVGSGSVVASHSLVTKDVPPNTLVAGVPARVIRTNVQWKR